MGAGSGPSPGNPLLPRGLPQGTPPADLDRGVVRRPMDNNNNNINNNINLMANRERDHREGQLFDGQRQQEDEHLENMDNNNTEPHVHLTSQVMSRASHTRANRLRHSLEAGHYAASGFEDTGRENDAAMVYVFYMSPESVPASRFLHKHQLELSKVMEPAKEEEIDLPGIPLVWGIPMPHVRYYAWPLFRRYPSLAQKEDFMRRADQLIANLGNGGVGRAESLIREMNEFDLDDQLDQVKRRLRIAIWRHEAEAFEALLNSRGFWRPKPPPFEPAQDPADATDFPYLHLLSLLTSRRDACKLNSRVAASPHRTAFASRARGSRSAEGLVGFVS